MLITYFTGTEVDQKESNSPNPNPGSIQNGYEYYGSYSNTNINHNINHGTHHNTQHTGTVETFDK